MTIIVTGGAGFIGSNFIFYMLGKYPAYRIVCLDKLTYAGNLSTLSGIFTHPSFRFVKGDICDEEDGIDPAVVVDSVTRRLAKRHSKIDPADIPAIVNLELAYEETLSTF